MSYKIDNTRKNIKEFPKHFLWGASSSAFQVEGAYNLDDKGLTVADVNAKKRAHLQADTSVASDFYHHWKEDIDLMHELGLSMYRFSIAWSRIIPDGDGAVNQKGIEFYRKILEYLHTKKIEPFVTLYHFDLPYALVEKYNGWESRKCVEAFVRYASVCFNAFGDLVKYWQVHNEQNLMIRVDERMNLICDDAHIKDKIRAQMDYHMFLAHAITVNQCHQLVMDGKIAPAISSTCTYPFTPKPDDVWSAIQNDAFKSEYCLDMYMYGSYPEYYLRYLEQRKIMPLMKAMDEKILKKDRMDYLAVNYYRTLCTRYLPADENHLIGDRIYRENEVDFDQYGYFWHEPNMNLKRTEYGSQIDPMGLRIILNRYYQRYQLPIYITENGLGMEDKIAEDGKIHDNYRIDYLRQHIQACYDAITDGVRLMGYSPWSFTDLLSSHQGFRKRYGLVYVNRNDKEQMDLKRICKDSYFWYQKVIKSNGGDLL